MGTELIPKTEEAVPAESPTAVEQQIIRQIEYYFGNFNLSRDKFLREQLKLDDGWVPLKIMVTFNRLKKISEDFAVITEALKKSPKQLMEVNEDGTKIRRRVATPIPDDYNKRQEELDKRTIYVKGFKQTNTLDELLEYFKEHNVENILMRRNLQQNDRPFKGSLFVTFETEDDAKKFFETKGLKYNGTELLKEWKSDYIKRKDDQYQTRKAEKEKRLLKRAGMEKTEANNQKVPEFDMIPGCLLKLMNVDRHIAREDIKEVFEPYGTVVYIDYNKGNPSAVIRFESGIASSVLEKLSEEDGDRKIDIGSSKSVVTLIEGEDESEYWKSMAISRAQSRLRFKNKGYKNQHKGNKGRFKKWGKRKGNDDQEDDSSEPTLKKTKVEEKESVKTETSSEDTKVKEEPSET